MTYWNTIKILNLNIDEYEKELGNDRHPPDGSMPGVWADAQSVGV